MGATVDELLAEQRRYYRERGPSTTTGWFRRAAYALDAETESRGFADVRELEAALEAFGSRGDVSGSPRGPESGPASPFRPPAAQAA